MNMRFFLTSMVVVFSMIHGSGNATMFGPWFRYECEKLGFQIPVASGWKVTEVPNGIVFAMQYQPEPYVRVAVGRVPLGDDSLERRVKEDALL
jgi:hypothetical protein